MKEVEFNISHSYERTPDVRKELTRYLQDNIN